VVSTFGWRKAWKEKNLTLRKRSGNWHYRFEYKGQEYSGNTDLAATPQNKTEAHEIEAEALKALKRGKQD
jgi:hypothetical protein